MKDQCGANEDVLALATSREFSGDLSHTELVSGVFVAPVPKMKIGSFISCSVLG